MSKQQELNAVKKYYSHYYTRFDISIDSKLSLSDEMRGMEAIAHQHLAEAKIEAKLDFADDAVFVGASKRQKEAPMSHETERSWEYLSMFYAAQKAVKSRTIGDFFRHPFKFISERLALSDLRDKVKAAAGYSQETLDEAMTNIGKAVGDIKTDSPKTNATEKENKEPEIKQEAFTKEELEIIAKADKARDLEYQKATEKINRELHSNDELDLEKLGQDVSLDSQTNEKSQPKTEKQEPEKVMEAPKSDM